MAQGGEERVSIPASPGPMSRDEAVTYTNQQLYYPNLADDPAIADRAVHYVNELSRHYTDKMLGLWRRWRANNWMLQGNTLNIGFLEDIHVPELYKMLETMIPRIEEPIHDLDPWFRVLGRDKMDRVRSEGVAALLDWQLDQARYKKIIQPLIRDLLIYQVAIIRVRWDRRVEERVRHWAKVRTDEKGQPIYDHYRRVVKEVTYDGPRLEQVDPFNFIIDTRASDVEDAAFVGHRADVFLHELKRLQEIGFYKNVDRIEEKDQPRDASYRDMNKWSRSVTERYGYQDKLPKSLPEKPEVVEVECLWDLYDDGVERECVLTVANGKTCLQARENTHDRKIRTYAVARAAKHGHEFFNIGPLDNAVRVNVEYDRHRSSVLRAHELMVSPIAFAEGEESDLPDSIYDLRPGSILKAVGNVTLTRVPDTLQSAPYVDGMLRRDIEEIVGAPRIYQGSSDDGSTTATEIERKIQEGNRRMRGLIREYAGMWHRVLEIMHALNGQFVTGRTTFRVLGKRAATLGHTYNIGPDTLLHAVDFDFIGLTSLHTYGTRATSLMTWVQTWLPVAMQYPEDFNLRAMAKESFDLSVGRRAETELIRVPTPREMLMAQEQENAILAQGQSVPVDQDDDDEEHVRQMVESGFLDWAMSKAPDYVNEVVQEHLQLHIAQAEQKEAAARARAQEERVQEQTRPPEAGGQSGPGGVSSPQRGGLSAAAAGNVPGESPGPPRERLTPQLGRGPGPVDQPRNREGGP